MSLDGESHPHLLGISIARGHAMALRILITGGAGFIGSHLADELLSCDHEVRVLDSLVPQVHGRARTRPAYLDPDVELVVGDIRDKDCVRRALRGVDAVFHLAALVGVGQSMYQIAEYTSVNNHGTATLLEALTEAPVDHPVERLVVASSMSIYGEGLYRDAGGAVLAHAARSAEMLRKGVWELHDQRGARLSPVPTVESKPPSLTSVYALSKYDQERLCMLIGQAYAIPTVALRFFNVFGPRQALSNPYTGVLAIFAARYLDDRPPMIFEDGLQQRDFVNVRDVARACRLALTVPDAAGQVLNVGSGRAMTIREVARRMGAILGKQHIEPAITGEYRVGDIRHCVADIGRARDLLGYEPGVSFDQGLAELAEWLETQMGAAQDVPAHVPAAALPGLVSRPGARPMDAVDRARAELAARGLVI
jgi:dTDP-L-rhamnose 4-epimerase